MSCTRTKGNQAAVPRTVRAVRAATYLVDMSASHLPSHPASGVPRVDHSAANSRWVGPESCKSRQD